MRTIDLIFAVSACASKRGESDGTVLMRKTLQALVKATASKMSDGA